MINLNGEKMYTYKTDDKLIVFVIDANQKRVVHHQLRG